MNTRKLCQGFPDYLRVSLLLTLLLFIGSSASAQTPVSLIGFWDFNDTGNPNQAVSSVGGYVGAFENGAAYTADQDQRS
jgi:hypothetical protein